MVGFWASEWWRKKKKSEGRVESVVFIVGFIVGSVLRGLYESQDSFQDVYVLRI